jgi:tetratricopeptide (TPR) repeat protein
MIMPLPASPAPVLSSPLAEESGIVPLTPEAAPVPSSGNSVMPTRAFVAPIAPIAPLSPGLKPGNSASADSKPRQEQTETKFRLTHATPQTNTVLEHAYEALQSGRNEEAQGGYDQVLRADGKNTDALLGLATLAARQGQVDTAHGYYLRALEADPSDATARAGVLSTGRQSDDDVETHLKTALARQPDSPSLLFALGNLYARQQRWSEAQQTYFQAYTGESDNPDIIFNLAVSLDHLRQNRLAAQYYRMALDASDSRTAAFDRNRVEVRLLQLQP